MNHKLKTGQVVDKISAYLGDCSQKAIASLIAVSGTALSQARERTLEEATEHKVGKRLMGLLYVVETLVKDATLNPQSILKVLITPCYPHEEETFISVTSAIQLETFSNEQLMQVADAALKRFRTPYESDKRPIANGLYQQAIAG
jgi:hypothetical protein